MSKNKLFVIYMLPKIFVVVLNWNGKKFLKNCLSSLILSSYKNIKIIVVDNVSTDGSQEFMRKHFPNIHMIENKENLGWSGGNNVGVIYALKQHADAIFILNNDTEIEKNTISILGQALFADSKIGIVGPKIFSGKKIISFAGGYFTPNRYFGMHTGNNEIDIGQYDKEMETQFITGAAMLVKKDVFEKIGLFTEDYFAYYEDADFNIRARKSGFAITYIPQASIYHVFSGTIKVGSPLQHYYTTRNHYLFVERHAPLDVKLREWLRTPKTIYEFIKSDDKNKKKYSLLGIRDYYIRRFGKQTYWQ